VEETQCLARDPFLADRFRDGVGGGEGDSFRNFDLARFVDRVGLRSLERFVLAAAIVGGQTRKELTSQAVGVIRTEFDNAVSELGQSPPFEHAKFAPAQMSKILFNLLVDHSQDAPLLEGMQRQALLVAAQSNLGKEAMTPILQHLYTKLRYLLYTR
jgi:CCR4-NOT transcription complex subunit 1